MQPSPGHSNFSVNTHWILPQKIFLSAELTGASIVTSLQNEVQKDKEKFMGKKMSRGHRQETYRKRNTNSLQAHSIQDMNTKKMSPCNTVKHPRPVKVSTHLEPDILEHEVNWALGSIATSKASGGDGIPVELFQILKDDAVKVLHSICQQIWKTQQWPQDWKWSVFIPIPKKGNAKECSNYCTIALISHASKFSKPGFNST